MARPWIVVPVKCLDQAKHRLSPVLSKSERAALMMAMLQDVLGVLCGMSEHEALVVATRSRRAREIASRFGLPVFEESRGANHSQTVTEASHQIASEYGAQRMLALSADIPGGPQRDIDRKQLQRRRPAARSARCAARRTSTRPAAGRDNLSASIWIAADARPE